MRDQRLPRVTLAGGRSGDYLIAEERPDGTLLLRPDTSVEAIFRRARAQPANLAEFETDYGAIDRGSEK